MEYVTRMEIDLKKLKNNTKLLNKSYSDYKYKFADLMDNGHGLGLKIIDTMNQYGIDFCLVGSLKEALEIRKFNKKVNILLNCSVTKEEIYDCINNNITLTIFDLETASVLLDLKLKDLVKVHIVIDNGSNLIGISSKEELREVIELIAKTNNVKLEGIYTEITTLGVEDEFYYEQLDNFYNIISEYAKNDLIIHLNEPIMYHHKKEFVNGIRFDLSILGIEENINDNLLTNMKIKNIQKKYNDLEFPDIDLKLIFNIVSEVSAIRFVKKGNLIGKNYVTKKDMYVALIPIGHKDGITKAINYVGINNYKRYILADAINHIVVEVTEDIKPKDKVYILNEEREIYDFLNILKTNRYYLMSILNRNLKKVYLNEEIREESYL